MAHHHARIVYSDPEDLLPEPQRPVPIVGLHDRSDRYAWLRAISLCVSAAALTGTGLFVISIVLVLASGRHP